MSLFPEFQNMILSPQRTFFLTTSKHKATLLKLSSQMKDKKFSPQPYLTHCFRLHDSLKKFITSDLLSMGKTTQYLADKPSLPLTMCSSLIGSIDVDTNSMALFLDNMKQGCKLQREVLFCESHTCQPANSPLSVLIINTEAAD